ncbi:PTS sugar transporter subunit IIC [Apilactobacillus kunkeei]|nr:PTS sugar transporter subunit IIC [Apilactobacillus kunkeei]
MRFRNSNSPALAWLSGVIAKTLVINPFIGGLVISVVWAIFLMTPASSAALAIAVMLDPLSSGAAGLGTNSLIAPLTFASQSLSKLAIFVVLGIVILSIISVTIMKILKACHKIKDDDMKMNIL